MKGTGLEAQLFLLHHYTWGRQPEKRGRA